MNRDLTSGKPQKVLWAFCLPLFGSVIFQQMYNIADSLIAGKFVGENALAAVGNSYEITLIFIAFAFGCNIGCSVIVAQLQYRVLGDRQQILWVQRISSCENSGTYHTDQRRNFMRIVDVIRISVLQQAACHDPYTGGNHGRLGAVPDDLYRRSSLSLLL